MSYTDYFKSTIWEYDQIKVQGISVAGIGTCFFLPEYSICIDVAQGLPFAQNAKNFLITHAHMDHAAGIPYIISQRAISNAKPPNFYMHENIVKPLENVMDAWTKVDGHTYDFHFKPVVASQEYILDSAHSFKPFETFHRVQSLGYTIFENRKKLKQEFVNMHRDQILKLKEQGTELTDHVSIPVFSYTGDTKIEFWDKNPHVRKSKVLFMEVTYWDQAKTIQDARDWGHIHLDEILPRLDEFEGEKLVFTHISSRYSEKYIKNIIKEKVPTKYQDKVDFFPFL